MAQEVVLSRAANRMIGFGPTTVYFHGVSDETSWNINRKNPETFDPIEGVVPYGIRRVWMPIPSQANGVITKLWQMRPQFEATGRVEFMGKVNADGCPIPTGEAFAVCSADCATVVAYSKDHLVTLAAHAGRDSVLERSFIKTGNACRQNLGVLHSIVAAMWALGYDPREVFLGVFGGIRTNFLHPPDHAEYGGFNRRLISFCKRIDGAVLDDQTGDIDMYAVIAGVAVRIGILEKHIFFDDVDTGSDVDEHGNPLWASHRHGKPGMRNLCIVHNHG